MFKMTFSKIKKLCSVALIPRILRDEVSLSPRKLGKRPLDGFWKMGKSTDAKDSEAECEKCKKLIEMVFGREKPENLLKQVETNIEDMQMDKIQKVVSPNININKKLNESSGLLAVENTKNELESDEKIVTESTDESIIKNSEEQAALPLDNVIKATTAKTTEEQLAQKLETIEEPELVEASTPKVEGFNTFPKVLGGQENVLDGKTLLCSKISPEEDALNEIARKCLGTPPDKIDERILEELKNCGMLGRGRKKSTLSKSDCHAIKYDEKEALVGAKSETNSLYCKNLENPGNVFNDYPVWRYNMNISHDLQSVFPAYFKNVHLRFNEDGVSIDKTDIQKITNLEQKEEKTSVEDIKTKPEEDKSILMSSETAAVVNSVNINAINNNETSQKIETLEELSTVTISNKEEDKSILMSSETTTEVNSDNINAINNNGTSQKTDTLDETSTVTISNEEKNRTEIIENIEMEVEEMRVTAAETSHVEIPGESEIDPDFDHKRIRPEIFQSAEPYIQERYSEPDTHEEFVFTSAKHPSDWHLRADYPDQPYNNPNTAISSTFPIPPPSDKKETEGSQDTSISSHQNPSEYFDLSQSTMEQEDDEYVMSRLSEIRALPAFHQYTIISGTEETETSENIIFLTKDTPEVSPYHSPELKYGPQTEDDLPHIINRDISATVGPVPQFKEMEEELPLTEMLRRVRERNRLEYCRECAFKAVEAEPAEASKCPPPLEKPGTLGPGPCKPKPKPECPPPPCPPPCPPKKDPCAKFSKASFIGDKIKEAFTLVLQVAFRPAFRPSPINSYKKANTEEPLKKALDDDVDRMEKLGSFLLSSCPETEKKGFENEDVTLARDYEPWAPIPSWPIPKKEQKKPFVCPKEGCKLIPPPRLNAPCKENPCINLPKRTFSLIENYEPFYLYDNKF